ncbi:Os02g0202800 [Oryza sativa Japonica Group]|uniref:Os02g0202800 protein n=2 Tax=Oryza sativa subsp. japonica TaxID=39947 RepID=Q6ZHU2_ORYSJ|nr:hypothetical protein EE612_009590 [Oryza sativa]BAD15501.1 unknown protein [Oryza sativa Japonica Group]BAG98645.1 unnamed protein product [Oryza sativa Japonica Group]BAS77532.1 Os02g0202800 [Oryza sativa Japonica Group]
MSGPVVPLAWTAQGPCEPSPGSGPLPVSAAASDPPAPSSSVPAGGREPSASGLPPAVTPQLGVMTFGLA